jgi:hypothetical protein
MRVQCCNCMDHLLIIRRATNMERNAIGKKKFANGIICIIMVQLTIHPCNSWSYCTRTRTLCLDEDVPLPIGDGGGIRPMDGLLLAFLLELAVASTL